MNDLLLVRHAMPQIEPTIDAAHWSLSPDGRTASVELAARLDQWGPVARLVSSHETKAVETALPIADRFAVPLEVDERLAEARRPWTGGDYRKVAVSWLTDEQPPPGWEARQRVVERWDTVLGGLLSTEVSGSTVVVGHGLAITAWLADGSGRDPVSFWSNLRMPDVHYVKGRHDTT